jgi:DNA-binding XRE family transcriptional regulator
VKRPNDPSSATRRTGRHDCNRDAPAGFAAAHGLARLTFTQRTIEVPLPTKTGQFTLSKPLPARISTLGHLLVGRRKEARLTQKDVAKKTGIPRKWVARWERGRAMPDQAQWTKLATILPLPPDSKLVSP